MIQQDHDITLRDLVDECRKMDIVLDDKAMIQQNASEHSYVRKIAQPSRKILQTGSPHFCASYAAKCTITEIVLIEITFLMSGERKDKEGKCRNDMKGHLEKRRMLPRSKPENEDKEKPVFCPQRSVPFSTIQNVEEELSHLERIGVLHPVSYSK
ncbi:hypothetical protein ACTXT7_008009 [Hymenolepis weldensis]